MNTTKEHPKVFISYSWSGPEHEQFVMDLATALRTHGADAILDKWRLKPGQDKYSFMETMVTDPDVVKVLVLCDEQYKKKADSRSGGVGTESQIISQELYTKVAQSKFIPVVCERGKDGEEFLPVFMKGRIYVDLSRDEKYGEGLDELLRLIFEQPLCPEPGLGEVPSFLKPEGGGLPMAKEFSGTLRSIRDGKPNREGLETLFVRSVVAEITRLYIQPEANAGYDEEIYQAILKTKGLRDQVSEYVDTAASFGGDEPKALRPSISLLEQLGQRFGPPERGDYVESWADIYRFFALETVLVITAALLRYERWQMLRHFLKYPYLIRDDHSGPRTEDVIIFDSHIVSMDTHRNNRLHANRVCFTADMLKERCSQEYTPFLDLIQADVFLTLYGVSHLAEGKKNGFSYKYWSPRTTVYRSGAKSMPIFLKAVDPDIRKGIWSAIGVSSASDLAERTEAARLALNGFERLSPGRIPMFDFVKGANLKELTA